MSYHSPEFRAHDGAHFAHLRATSPADLVAVYGRPRTVTGVYPLARGGYAVIAIQYDPTYSLHPLAIITRDGAHHPVPVRGLRHSTRPGFVAEIDPSRPIRHRGDANDVAALWVREVVDGLPTSGR